MRSLESWKQTTQSVRPIRLIWRDVVFESDEHSVLALYAVFLADEYGFLRNLATRNDTVIDVGANIGAFSIMIHSRVKKVLAIEPHPVTFSLLKRNITLNRALNVEPMNIAISNYIGSGFMSGRGETARLADSGILVKTTTLDAIIDSIEGPLIMKVDVEGHETVILNTINSWSQIRGLAVETHGTLPKVYALLHNHGYVITLYRTSKAELYKRAISKELLRNEFITRFLVTRKAIPSLFRKSVYLPLPIGTLLYAMR